MNSSLPPSFRARYLPLLGPEVLDRLAYSPKSTKDSSVRLHPRRLTAARFQQLADIYGWRITALPWDDQSFSVNSRDGTPLSATPEYFAGLYYIQEIASMLPPLVLCPTPHSRVLDMTAAPGSKTTEMSHLMKNTGAIIANDLDPRRMKALAFNLEKQGCQNVALTCGDARRFGSEVPETFDLVLLDAPCSAEGSIAKDPTYFRYWHENKIPRLSLLQKELLTSALQTCKIDGTIVYSTCTIAPEENEEVLTWLLENYGDQVEIESIENFTTIPRSQITSWQGRNYRPEVSRAIHILPTENTCDSFFISRIKKTAPLGPAGKESKNHYASFGGKPTRADILEQVISRFALAPSSSGDVEVTQIKEQYWLSSQDLHEFLLNFPLKIDRSGLPLGRETQKGFRMAFPAALEYASQARQNVAELDGDNARQFVRGNTVSCVNEAALPPGQVLVRHEDVGLGRALFTGENPLKNQTPPEFVLRSKTL